MNQRDRIRNTGFNLFRLDHNVWSPASAAPVRLPANRALQRVPVHQVHVHGGSMQAYTSSRGTVID